MSRGVPEPKLTAMDAMIDKLTGAIFIFQLAVVVVLGSAGNVWKETEARKVHLFVTCLIVVFNLNSLLSSADMYYFLGTSYDEVSCKM